MKTHTTLGRSAIESAVKIMIVGRGKHFDAGIVDAFVQIQEQVQAIAARFADTGIKQKKEYLAKAGAA
jgi:HD-GYP domain-containing protein (c-di-GMP phosphodiesterase class II)